MHCNYNLWCIVCAVCRCSIRLHNCKLCIAFLSLEDCQQKHTTLHSKPRKRHVTCNSSIGQQIFCNTSYKTRLLFLVTKETTCQLSGWLVAPEIHVVSLSVSNSCCIKSIRFSSFISPMQVSCTLNCTASTALLTAGTTRLFQVESEPMSQRRELHVPHRTFWHPVTCSATNWTNR